MNRIVGWAISNSPGMNMLVVAVLAVGGFSLYNMQREMFPAFELEVVTVQVPYPGATPQDCEEAICQKIESAVRSIDGIKNIQGIAMEGMGSVMCELRTDVKDVQKVMAEIDREVARIPSFPTLAEDPQVQQFTFRQPAIYVGIIGPPDRSSHGRLRLREVAESVYDDLIALPQVSSANIMAAPPYQIDVEISEKTLQSYGLSLDRVASIIRSRNIELPGGQLKSEGQEILLRAKNKGRVGDAIKQIPLITDSGGTVLTVNDIGRVYDEFDDSTSIDELNGEPAMVVSVERSQSEDLLALVDTVREFIGGRPLPEGYRFLLWSDASTEVRARIDMLLRNGVQGLMLVFLVLTLFLEMRLAFWVALGIPISVLGTGAIMAWGDQSLNWLSTFAFLIALGIVVDDAIVIGENIYAHMQMGKTLVQAAIDGAVEVMPSVLASVSTTIIAFSPMFFVVGQMGKFMAVIPFVVIAMLAISLWESIFVLPCHLSHKHTGFFRVLSVLSYPLRPLGLALGWLSQRAGRGLEWICRNLYVPALRFCLHHPVVPLAGAMSMVIVTFGMIRGGIVPTSFFPKSDSPRLHATIAFPDGTSQVETDAATRRMEQALHRVSERIGAERAQQEGLPAEQIYDFEGETGDGPVRLTFRQVGSASNFRGPTSGGGASGSHSGQVIAELYDTDIRAIHSDRLLAAWREEAGEFPGAEKVLFSSVDMGPGGKAIEFKLLSAAANVDQLLAATELTKERLAEFTGVFDIADDNTPGKWEFQFRVKDRALATGVTPTDLGETVRNAYFGAEAMRLQRGRHEVKLMVRYPEDERRSLVDFREIRVRTEDGSERPITELAEVELTRGFSEINRINQYRSITISAEIDETAANAALIIAELKNDFIPTMTASYPGVGVLWEGQAQQSRESMGSMVSGFGVAVLAIFVLLVLQFRSYIQPLLIMMIIPFAMIGAVWGHAIMGLPLTFFSSTGLVALSGVVINDSIVLIDFINTRLRSGIPLYEALLESGERRFRPIALTSMTTIAGLTPIMLEKSFQAQMVIPMAVSLVFGLMFGTILILILVPTFYLLYERFIELFGSNAAVDPE